MRKIINSITPVLFVALILISCENNENISNEKTLVPIKIDIYQEEGSGIYDFDYDNSNKLIKIDKNNGDSIIIEYDTNGKIAKILDYEESNLWSYDLYEYNNLDQIVEIRTLDYEDYTRNVFIYEYDINENLIKKTEYFFGSIESYITFSYDNQGNVIYKSKFLTNSSGQFSTEPDEEWTYTFDDKNTIKKNLNIPFLKLSAPFVWESYTNNLTTIYNSELIDDEISTHSYVIDYIYNEDKYPIEYSVYYTSYELGALIKNLVERCVIEYREI